MIKGLIEKAVRSSKNKDFRFDERIKTRTLLTFITTLTSQWLRGLKVVFKGRYFPLLFLGSNVKFIHLYNIDIGKSVVIGDGCLLDSLGIEKIRLGNGVRIGAYSRLITSMTLGNLGKGITFEDNVAIGEFSCIGGAGGVHIGEGSIIGGYLSTHPENHVYSDIHTPIRNQGVTRKGISIGKNCWLGAKVTILDGVDIGDNSIVAAGAVVTKSFGQNVIIGGVPAKILKQRS